MKSIPYAATAIALAVLVGGLQVLTAEEEPKKETKPQTKCPIMGGDINKSIFADHEGKRVYFCCDGCPAKFKKDPAKYIKQLEDAGITLDKTPADTDKKDDKVKETSDCGGKKKHGCCP